MKNVAQSDLVLFEAAARAAHEANRAWCLSHGDVSQVSWDEASDDIKQSCMQGVKQVFAGATPASLHDSWMKNRIEHGWVYGPVKDVEKKIHPCLVPYGELPQEQRAKDEIFLRVVTAFFQAGGLTSLAAAAFPDSMPRRLHRAKRAVVALSAGIKNVLTDSSPEIRRASGECICDAPDCGLTYAEHPVHFTLDFLHILCDGSSVKL